MTAVNEQSVRNSFDELNNVTPQKWGVLQVPRVLGKDTGITASSWVDVYEAPDKVRGVIKLITIVATAAAKTTVDGRIVDHMSQNIHVFRVVLDGQYESARPIEQGEELVIEPTWKLQFNSTETTIDYVVSGVEWREQQ